MIYSFMCSSCDARADLDFKMGEAPRKAKCPSCGEEAKRVYEATAVVFKGTGWPSKAISFKKQMTEKNDISFNRMRDNNPSVHDAKI